MSIYETTHGTAYANDPDYDRMTGYVTRTYQSEWRDAQGNLWRKTCTVINLGRADRVTPQTGEELLHTEKMPGDLRSSAQQRAGRIAAGRARRQAKRDAIAELLQAQGPLTCAEIAEALGYVAKTTREILEASRYELFDKVGGVPGAHGGVPVAIWGLAGVHEVRL